MLLISITSVEDWSEDKFKEREKQKVEKHG